jgi:hypothetical protein|uniref:Uncharacterized protein n=1 Tax=virus sp. ctQ5V6 TaxID=2825815 RepID=A0A8S5RQY6_9VIRU|nr:MAG TPA: hypothetical protein [virus sp. ctQ5V6]
MLSVQKSVNFSGMSSVEVDGKQKVFAYFNANIGTDGKHNVNYSIQDEELYKANKDIFKADRAEFEDAVDAYSAE